MSRETGLRKQGLCKTWTDLSLAKKEMPAKRKFKIYTHFFYKEKLRTYDVDNDGFLGKSVEIEVFSRMAG